MLKIALSLVILASISASAAPALTFEQTLGQLRERTVAAVRKIRLKNATTPAEIKEWGEATHEFFWDARHLRDTLRDLGFRVRRYNPDQPGRPQQDPFLSNDLRRLIWEMRDFNRHMSLHLQRVQTAYRNAAPNAELVEPAELLSTRAQNVQFEVDWLESDARNIDWDLRRANFSFEAMDIEREMARMPQITRDVLREANLLLNKVRP